MPDPNVSTILRDHVALSITSFDRLYLNGYIPHLQTSGQVVAFCHDVLHQPLASPALFGPLRQRFMQAVHAFAEQHQVPVVSFQRGQRKDAVAAWYRARFKAEEGVVFIGLAQEKASSFKAAKRTRSDGHLWFEFSRQPVAVNHVYFYGATSKSRVVSERR